MRGSHWLRELRGLSKIDLRIKYNKNTLKNTKISFSFSEKHYHKPHRHDNSTSLKLSDIPRIETRLQNFSVNVAKEHYGHRYRVYQVFHERWSSDGGMRPSHMATKYIQKGFWVKVFVWNAWGSLHWVLKEKQPWQKGIPLWWTYLMGAESLQA